MSCPFSPEELSAYVDGEVGEGIDARIRQHLQHCARCAQIVASFELISTSLRQQPQVQMHRSVVADVCDAVAAQHEQRPLPCRRALPMASALVDGELPAAEAASVRAHLSACEECEREYALMRSCARLLAEREAAVPSPALRAHIMEAVAQASPPRGRAAPLVRLPSWRRAVALSSTVAVAAALALAMLNVQWHAPSATEGPLPPETIAAHTAPAPAPTGPPEPVVTQPPVTPAAGPLERTTEARVSEPPPAPAATSTPRGRGEGPEPAEASPPATVEHRVAELDVIGGGVPPGPLENADSEPLRSLGEPSERADQWTTWAYEPGGEATGYR